MNTISKPCISIPLKDDSPMGWVYINESFSESENSVSSLDVNHSADLFFITFDTNLQDFDVLNRNKRYYDKDNIWQCIMTEKIQSLLRSNGWFGEFDHPDAEIAGEKLSPQRLQNVPPKYRAFKIMAPHMVGNVLKAKIQSAQGEVGESFGKEVLAGWIPQFSVRAIAMMVSRNGKPYVIVKKLVTYDAPWYPSHKIAHAISNPVIHHEPLVPNNFSSFTERTEDTPIRSASEIVNGVLIPLKEILEDVGKTDVNVNMIMEAFDLPLESICGFSADKKALLIRDDDNVLYANINPESSRKVKDFFSSF